MLSFHSGHPFFIPMSSRFIDFRIAREEKWKLRIKPERKRAEGAGAHEKTTSVIFMLAAAYTALAQSNASKSPAAEPALNVRKGQARLVGHFNDPRQGWRLAFGLAPPHLAEEEDGQLEFPAAASPNDCARCSEGSQPHFQDWQREENR
jgi:hypothetical protein